MRKSHRKTPGECNTSSTTLPKQCIFCKRDKYQTNSKTREKLSCCIQLRADEKIRKIATQKNDHELLAIASDELIAKEAHYHASCYRLYTKIEPVRQKLPVLTETETEFSKAWNLLICLFENPRVEEFRKIQDVYESDAGRKNLKRKIEGKTDMFRFVKTGKELLIYPTSLTMDNLVLEYYESVKMIKKLQAMGETEKAVRNTATIKWNGRVQNGMASESR